MNPRIRVLDAYPGVPLATPCWEWMGRVNSAGYGPHRREYKRAGKVVGMQQDLDHLCRNKRCCNPEHLEPVTRAENLKRGAGSPGITPATRAGRVASQKAKTHCPAGHLYQGDNLYVYADGRRACRVCIRNRVRVRKAISPDRWIKT